jgi:hypothetical protein
MCFGGPPCFNDGRIIEKGEITFSATEQPHPHTNPGALRRLVLRMGADIGRRQFFDPLRRDFDWVSGT